MKAKFLVLLALVLGVVSCQTEPEALDVNVGGEIDAIVNVTIPEVETRAGGNNSALGVFDNGVLAGDATMRYILQVYYKGEPSLERLVKYSDGKSVAFDVRLVPGRDYQFVVWADVVDGEDMGDKHYNTENLANIQLNRTWFAMDESRDAFTATVAVNDYSSASNITVKLQRPFAKLRVVTTDMVALNNLEIKPTKATVEYTVQHYNAFNAFEGKVINNSNSRDIKHEKFVIAPYGDNSNTDKVLFTDYFFPTEDNLIKFNLEVFDQNDDQIGETVAFNTDIPVNANYLTTIKGNILTDGKNFNVTIDDAFAQPEIEWPNTPAGELAYAAMFGGEVTLTKDVELTEPLKVTSELTIYLNGKTITTTEKEPGRHHYAIDNYGTLTLKGKGAINARGIENFGTMTINGNITITNVDTNGGSAIWNEGNLVINGGTFTTNAEAGEGSYGSALNTQANGSAVINGGNFTAYSQLTYAILNYGETVINNATVKGKHGAVGSADGAAYKTTINGGSFELMENPGVSDHCTYYVSAIYGGTFSLGNNTDSGAQVFYESTIAAGYKVIEKDGKYVVVLADVENVVADSTELKAALEAGAKNVFVAAGNYTFPTAAFTANTVLTCEEGTVFEGNTKLNINGATVVGATFSNPSGTAVDQSINGTFKDCTFSGSNALRWCYAGETCVFENCVFDGEVYGVHFDGGANEVTFKNCVFSGLNAFGAAITQLNLEGCTFVGNGKSGYNGANLWGTTTMTNTTFVFDGSASTEWIGLNAAGSGKVISLDNCTVTNGSVFDYFANWEYGYQVTVDGVVYEFVADGVMKADEVYEISNAAGLTWFSDQLNNKKNTFAGKTVKVVNDIDMTGATYYGGSIAAYPSYCFKGIFDGGEKIISNLTITVENDVHGAAALIPTLAGDGTTIKNVRLKDVNISSSHYAGGIWGYTTSDNCWINVTNCHVEGGTITGNIYNGDNADKVGGIGGIFYTGTVNNCSVKNVTISGYRDIAGIVGWAADTRAAIKNNSLENVTINVNNTTNYKNYTNRAQYDVNNYVGEGVGKAKLEGNTGEATINWGSIAE